MFVCSDANRNPYKIRLRAFIDASLKVAPPTVDFPEDENIENTFYVYPSDPCHST